MAVGFWVAGLLLLEAGVVAITFSAVAARTTTQRGATWGVGRGGGQMGVGSAWGQAAMWQETWVRRVNGREAALEMTVGHARVRCACARGHA
jgi:hypothetical protein